MSFLRWRWSPASPLAFCRISTSRDVSYNMSFFGRSCCDSQASYRSAMRVCFTKSYVRLMYRRVSGPPVHLTSLPHSNFRGVTFDVALPRQRPTGLPTFFAQNTPKQIGGCHSLFLFYKYECQRPRWLGRWSASQSRSISWVQVSPSACSYVGTFSCIKNIGGIRESVS